MSLLSPDRFSGSDGSDMPTPVKVSRVLLWVQVALNALGAGLQAYSLIIVTRMTDAGLAKFTKGKVTHQSDVPYVSLAIPGALMLLLAIVLVVVATRFKYHQRNIRFITIVVEILVILVSYGAYRLLACVIILPAIATIALLLQPLSKVWFTPDKVDK